MAQKVTVSTWISDAVDDNGLLRSFISDTLKIDKDDDKDVLLVDDQLYSKLKQLSQAVDALANKISMFYMYLNIINQYHNIPYHICNRRCKR